MPRVQPPGGEVDWPANEGVLGVVGVAPWATIEFCRVLYSRVAATKDWHYPRVLLDINTKLPSRGRHLQLGETDPSPDIAATIDELAASGATLAVVVCNTAHILHDRWAPGARIPILHIVEETARAAAAGGASTVAALVSDSLAQSGLYDRCLAACGLGSLSLTPDAQRIVNTAIAEVKIAGRLGDAGIKKIRELLSDVASRGADCVIAGCTELSLLESVCGQVGLRFVDSNVALAEAALRRLNVPSGLMRVHSNR